MEKINSLASADIVANNIQTLKQLFPTIVKEGSIDFNELKALLGETVEDKEEYYRFTWAGKSQARLEANKPTTATLRPCKEDSKEWDTTSNIFIEGENLEVLKLLQKSYANKIKMIYIDPPYNTGKDFVYKDNYADNLGNYLKLTGQTDDEGKKTRTNTESDGRYHSNWLNMMYPRLRLARNLMTDDGVIFISIDNHEVENLKKICCEILGEDNFIAQFIWRNGRTSSSIFTNEHEYILCFAKNLFKVEMISYNGDESIISDRAIKKVGFKNPASEIFFPKGIRFEGEDRIFDKIFGESEVIEVTSGILECKDNKLANDVRIKAGWVMKDMIESWLNKEDVIDSKGQKVSEFFFKSNGVLQYVKERGTIHPKTIIENISTKQGSIALDKLMKSKVFDYPKPVELIRYLLQIMSKDDIILDFFAGSGTTAHAVMHFNAEDGGSRKCISVQLPEPTDEKSEAFKAGYKTIAEITKERIRRAGEKIKKDYEDKEDIDKLDIGFKAFRLDSSNIQAWDGNPDNLEDQLDAFANNIKSDRTEEDILFELLLKYGLDLTVPIEEKSITGKKVFSVGQGTLFICLSDGITSVVSEGIGAWKQELNPVRCTVIFKDTGFESDKDKTNTMQILKRFGIEEVNSI